jgi:hypothetical protein
MTDVPIDFPGEFHMPPPHCLWVVTFMAPSDNMVALPVDRVLIEEVYVKVKVFPGKESPSQYKKDMIFFSKHIT